MLGVDTGGDMFTGMAQSQRGGYLSNGWVMRPLGRSFMSMS